METARSLRERSLEELLWQAVSARASGLVVLRDRDGLRHGVWVCGGFVLGVHVAGRFDPLLDVLRKHGALSPQAYRACVNALWRTGTRSGALAMEIAGVARPVVRDALKQQLCERMSALLEIAASRGHDAWLELREVPEAETSVRVPLGTLLRNIPGMPVQVPASPRLDKEAARKQLRELAKKLHPDRNGHLDEATRKSLEGDLARATALYHGFA
jgi:hypothetical protein